MALVVYQMAHSPYCIPITEALRASRTPFETHEVPNWDRTEIIQLSNGAAYAVPLLVDEDKPIFETSPDSQVIARYVDEHFAGGRLFPAPLEGLQSIIIDHLENQVEGVTFRLVDPLYIERMTELVPRTMLIRHKERRFGTGCVDAWRAEAHTLRAQADKLLAPYEATLQHSPFLLGENPVFADFLLYGILGNLTWQGWNQLDPTRQGALLAWATRLHAYSIPETLSR